MKVLLIPSAILIPREMRRYLGEIPTCLFPLGDKSMLEKIYDHYKDSVDKVYLVVGKEKEQVYRFLQAKNLPINPVDIDCVGGLGHTIYCGLKYIFENNETISQIFINFADTLLSNQPELTAKDVAYYSKEMMDAKWTFFTHEKGHITEILDKPSNKELNKKFGNVFVGMFQISNPKMFYKIIAECEGHSQIEMDSFYQTFLKYSQENPCEFFLSGKWFDVGHSEKYHQAKTGVEARSFNSIEIDESRGTLKKKSENKEKFIEEIKWYLKMPNQLQYLIPPIYEYSLSYQDPYVVMEYYGYHTLHEILIYGNIHITQWEKYFHKLRFVIDDMSQYVYHGDKSRMDQSLEEIYVKKTVDRLLDLKEDPNFSCFFENDISVNGKKMPSLQVCVEELPKLIKTRLLEKENHKFCIIHGDLCFSNILIERDMGFLRIIDPRGKFGSFDIYGDQRYEMAKLLHSLDGQYDHIIEDLFSVQVEATVIDFRLSSPTTDIYKVFEDIFSDYIVDILDLKLIESTLFLSMIPLHKDGLNRQYAMIATGLRLLEEATEGKWFG